MLKISSGKYRSRSIEVPPSVTVPTKSMVRTAIGNALQDDFRYAHLVLDLFAGSGALGFEALSRGAGHCIFVDASKEAFNIVRKNAQTLGEKNCTILNLDYKEALNKFEGKKFDIVFLDPPYKMKVVYEEVPAILINNDMLSDNGVVVLEFEGEINPPKELYSFYKEYRYGRTSCIILRK